MATAKKTTKVSTKKVSEVKTIDQLREDLAKLQAAHLESRKSHRAGELVNPHILTTQRKEIARVHTAISLAPTVAVKEEN